MLLKSGFGPAERPVEQIEKSWRAAEPVFSARLRRILQPGKKPVRCMAKEENNIEKNGERHDRLKEAVR